MINKITKADLEGFEYEHAITSNHSLKRGCKELFAVISINEEKVMYKVVHKAKIVIESHSLDAALEKYNEI